MQGKLDSSYNICAFVKLYTDTLLFIKSGLIDIFQDKNF